MPRTTEEMLKDAEVITEAHKDGYYGCSAREDRYSKLIAELSAKLRERDKRETELLTLIQEIKDDLYMRGENDSDGVRVLNIGNGILYSIDKVLPTPPKKED